MSYHPIFSIHSSVDQIASRRPRRDPPVMVAGYSNPKLMECRGEARVQSQFRIFAYIKTLEQRGLCSILPQYKL
jgi:hypothetical protein